MFKFSSSARPIVLIAGLVAASLSTPALAAKERTKGYTVTVPASALANPSDKVCMPRMMVDRSPRSTLPKTICQTRDEWAAQGVTIVLK